MYICNLRKRSQVLRSKVTKCQFCGPCRKSPAETAEASETPQRQADSAGKGKSFKGMSNSVGKSLDMTLLALRKHRALFKKVFAKLKKGPASNGQPLG